MNVLALHEAVEAVAPIEGVDSFGQIAFRPEATAEQKDQAAGIVAGWVDPAIPDWVSFVDSLSEISGFYPAIAASPMASIISSRIVRLASEGSDFKGAADPLISAWNSAPPALDQDQRNELTSVAENFAIPLAISDQDNTLSVPVASE